MIYYSYLRTGENCCSSCSPFCWSSIRYHYLDVVASVCSVPFEINNPFRVKLKLILACNLTHLLHSSKIKVWHWIGVLPMWFNIIAILVVRLRKWGPPIFKSRQIISTEQFAPIVYRQKKRAARTWFCLGFHFRHHYHFYGNGWPTRISV